MPLILYIEDNDDNAYMLSGRLEMAGFDVILAEDGETGVEMATTQAPDLVIMDLVLPGIDGLKATHQLRCHEGTRNIPVIALSSNASTEDRKMSLEAGCNDFDTKPVDFDRLIRKINACLN